MLSYGSEDSGLLFWKLKTLWYWWFLFSWSIMVFVGDWQIQIIFTQKNQYCVQIFVCTWCRLCAHYFHGRKHARNLWRPDIDLSAKQLNDDLKIYQKCTIFSSIFQKFTSQILIRIKVPWIFLFNVLLIDWSYGCLRDQWHRKNGMWE